MPRGEDPGGESSEHDAEVSGMEIPEELPPRMVQRRFSLSLEATRNFWLFMSMVVVIVVLSVGLYLKWRPDRGRYDNDLKYRYVLMKGEASPKRLSELEELFEVERNQRRIDSMRRDVEKYERLVRKRAALDEQARLKAQEAEQPKRDAAKLKNKQPFPFCRKDKPPEGTRKARVTCPRTPCPNRHQRTPRDP